MGAPRTQFADRLQASAVRTFFVLDSCHVSPQAASARRSWRDSCTGGGGSASARTPKIARERVSGSKRLSNTPNGPCGRWRRSLADCGGNPRGGAHRRADNGPYEKNPPRTPPDGLPASEVGQGSPAGEPRPAAASVTARHIVSVSLRVAATGRAGRPTVITTLCRRCGPTRPGRGSGEPVGGRSGEDPQDHALAHVGDREVEAGAERVGQAIAAIIGMDEPEAAAPRS